MTLCRTKREGVIAKLIFRLVDLKLGRFQEELKVHKCDLFYLSLFQWKSNRQIIGALLYVHTLSYSTMYDALLLGF